MENRDGTQIPGGSRAATPSPSEGGSQHQGSIPSPGGSPNRVGGREEYEEDSAELESDPSPDEDDIGDDDSEDETSDGDIDSAALLGR
jgi:hypothetical protein